MEKKMKNVNFGEALQALKNGKRISRVGWNGKGMFVEMIPEKSYSCSVINRHFVIKNVKNTYDTWVPSISDLLAEDYFIV